MLFDNNSISIDGPTSLAVSDNFKKRFESYGWDYIEINGHKEYEIFKASKRFKVQNQLLFPARLKLVMDHLINQEKLLRMEAR